MLRNTLILGSFGAVIALGACNPKVFVDLEEDAPTVAIRRPSSFDPSRFGATLAVIRGELRTSAETSRIAVGGGTGTPTFTYDVWTQSELGGFTIQDDLCKEPLDCSPETGAAIAGARRMNVGETCIVIGEPGVTNTIRFNCASDPGRTEVVPGPNDASDFGAALAAVPPDVAATSRLQMVIGAPGDNNEDGELFYYTPPPTGVLSLADAESDRDVVPFGSQLGATLATAELPAGFAGTTLSNTFLLAARLGGTGRVVLFQAGMTVAGTVSGAGELRAEVLACVDPPAGMDAGIEFGAALVAGDVIGADGIPEVYVGYGINAPAHTDEVRGINLADLTTPGAGCGRPGDPPALTPAVIGCPEDLTEDDSCVGSKFGTSIAIGDIDADGINDLIVGAPHLTVDGLAQAGGVFAISGHPTAIDISDSALMTTSDPKANALLGEAVAAAPSHLNLAGGIAERAEVVGGAPGRNKVYVFLCSQLGADRQSIGDRCIETPETATP